MSNTESDHKYPTLSNNLFHNPREYADLPEQLPTTPTNPFKTPPPFDRGNKAMAPGGSLSTDAFSFST